MNLKTSVAVVGGGISGIATAYYLYNAGYQVELIEASSDVGGRVGCDYIDGRRIEFGGKNIGRNYPKFRKFVSDVGDYKYEFFGINTSSKSNGKQKNINSEKPIATLMNLLSMIGIRDFARLVKLILAIRRDPENGYLRGPYFSRLSDELDDKPISHYFGARFSEQFIRPLTIRMNGCEPENYYLGNFGSNVKMILDKYDQLENGVYEVIETFLKNITVRTSTNVISVITDDQKVHGIQVEKDGVHSRLMYDAVVMSTPASVTAKLLKPAFPEASNLLSKIQYNPVSIVVAKYNRDIFNFDVRAQVFGSEVPLSNAGAYGINDLDIVRYTFSGKAADNITDVIQDSKQAVKLGETLLNPHFSVSESERVGYVHRFFRDGLCAYTDRHPVVIKEIFSRLHCCRGLTISGDYLRGASIEACFYSALEAANQIGQQFVAQSEHKHVI